METTGQLERLADSQRIAQADVGQDAPRATLRLHLWIEAEEGVVFGMGRLLLLEQVMRRGSLKAAAEQMNMSYRAAWGKIKATEQVLGRALIEKAAGNHGRYQLTTYGRQLMDRFSGLFREVEAFAVGRGSQMLPFALAPFDPEKVS